MKAVINVVLVLVAVGELVFLSWRYTTAGPPLPDISRAQLDAAILKDVRDYERQANLSRQDGWLAVAEIYLAFGLLPEADYCFRAAEGFGELPPKAHFLWGTCASRRGQLDEAVKHLTRVAESQHDLSGQAWLEIGLVQLRRQDIALAESALRAASQYPIAQLSLARLLSRTQRLPQAQQVLERMVRENPQSVRAHQMLSWVLLEQGQAEKARDQREKSLRCAEMVTLHTLAREWDETWHKKIGSGRLMTRGSELESAGNLTGAVAATRAAIDSVESDTAIRAFRPFYHMRLAQLLLKSGKPDAALAELRMVAWRAGESAELWELVGDAWLAQGNKQLAESAWRRGSTFRASRIPTSNIYLHQKLTQLLRPSDPDQAARQEALAVFELGLMRWHQGDLQGALNSFEKASMVLTDNADCWFYLGETRRATENLTGAQSAYQKCLALQPHHGRAGEALALVGSR